MDKCKCPDYPNSNQFQLSQSKSVQMNLISKSDPVVIHRTVENHLIRTGGLSPGVITHIFDHMGGIGN